MKKIIGIITALVLLVSSAAMAESIDFSKLSDEEVTALYLYAWREAGERGLEIDGNDKMLVNRTEWKENHRLMRFSNSDLNLSLNWTINNDYFKGKKDKKKQEEPQEEQIFTENTLGMPSKRPDFSNPWSITLSYTFAYTVKDNIYHYMNPIYYSLYNVTDEDAERSHTGKIVQTLNVSGDFNVTKKWKIGFTTGYDFQQKKFSYTSIDIYRDLHCWEMRFNWIPFGYRRGFSFTINVKASVLQDLKWNKKKDFRENL